MKADKSNKRFSLKHISVLRTLIIYLILIIFCLSVLMPFLIILFTSVKPLSEANHLPFTLLPETLDFSAYIEILTNKSIWRGLVNTLIIVVPVMFIGVVVSSIAAFAFAKLEFKGRDLLFSLLISSMMLPGVITMTPAYVLYDRIGWVNSWGPLMVPGLFGTASCIFFMRNYLMKIPNELIDAGKVDGLGNFRIFIRIVLPVIKPALIAQIILWFFAGYNDYFGPMLYIDSLNISTLQLLLQKLTEQQEGQIPIRMATCVFSLVPALIVYAFAQRSLIRGISLQGVKK